MLAPFRRLFLLATLPALAAAMLLVLAMRITSAQGNVDLSGSEWRIEVVGNVQITCTASIIQNASAISMHIVCPPLGEGDINGTIDQKSGEFTASGQLDIFGVSLSGIAAADSLSFSGTWSAGIFGSGTLTGRAPDREPRLQRPSFQR